MVARLKQYHYQMGSMVTGMIQDAGAVALNSDQSCVDELARRYAGRREIVAGGLRSLDSTCSTPPAVSTWVQGA